MITEVHLHEGVPYSNFLAGCPKVKGLTCFKDLAWSQTGGWLKIPNLGFLFIQKNWGPGCLGSTQFLVLFMDWLKKLINSHIMEFLKAKTLTKTTIIWQLNILGVTIILIAHISLSGKNSGFPFKFLGNDYYCIWRDFYNFHKKVFNL